MCAELLRCVPGPPFAPVVHHGRELAQPPLAWQEGHVTQGEVGDGAAGAVPRDLQFPGGNNDAKNVERVEIDCLECCENHGAGTPLEARRA